jgi:hypothetical protein
MILDNHRYRGLIAPEPGWMTAMYGGGRTVCTLAGDSANVRVPDDRDEEVEK